MPCPLQQQTKRKCLDFGHQQLDRSATSTSTPSAELKSHPGLTLRAKALSWSRPAQAWLFLALLCSLIGRSTAASSETCPVSIEYAVSLGQGGDNSAVPVFVGSLGITNNANVSPLILPCCAQSHVWELYMGSAMTIMTTVVLCCYNHRPNSAAPSAAAKAA